MTLKAGLQNKHWLLKAIVWVSITLVLTLLAMIIWSFLFTGSSFSQTDSLKWLQFLQTLATFLLPPLILAYLLSPTPARYLHLQKPKCRLYWPIITILLAIPGINLLSYLNQQMTLPDFLAPLEQFMRQQEENAAALTESFLQTNSVFGLIINILLMALLPAVAEELTFRGLIVAPFIAHDDTDQATNPHIAIWTSAIIFSAIHFQFYGFVPRMLLGALFGYALLWSGSIWVPMLMHFTNNCVAVLLYYYAYARGLDIDSLDAIGTEDTLWLGILSLILSVGTIYALRRSCTMKSASSRTSSGS